MDAPPTRFARAGEVDIAYQVLGDGPIDLLWVGGLCSNIEVLWEEPRWAALMRRLSSFSRLVVFDRRGCGISDRGGATTTPTLEERLEDVTAVLDAVGSERAALFGFSEGGQVSAMYAATYPERVSHVILYGTIARFIRDAEHPWGWRSRDEVDAFIEGVRRGWGERETAPAAAALWAPSLADDERFTDWLAKWARQSLSRRDVAPFLRANLSYDLYEVFPAVRVPALVLHRTDDVLVPVSNGRWIARQIPGSRLVELPGVDHFPSVGDAEGVAHEIETFLVGPGMPPVRDRRLLTIVVAELTQAAPTASLNDGAWREQLDSYSRAVEEQVGRFDGKSMTRPGEVVVATFDAPARAIRCATAIVDIAHRRGLDVRVGIHCGECEVAEEGVEGIAVHVATRIATEGAPRDVLVSGTVRDLVHGSGIRFGQGRDIELQVLDERRSVFPVRTEGVTPEDARRLTIEQANLLRCDGEYWTIAFEGEVAALRDTKGLHDLAQLLASPGAEVHVFDLAADGVSPTGSVSSEEARQAGLHPDDGTGEPMIDDTAREAYRRRLTDLEQELEAAEQQGDTGVATRVRDERSALLDQLTAAYGLGGRTRRTPDHVERARKAVSRRIRTTIIRVGDALPALGRHLRTAVHTGVFCSYQPERPLRWTVKAR